MWNHIQAVGIDLGTTYSLIAGVQDDGQVGVVSHDGGSTHLMPSTVTYVDGQEPIVGLSASQAQHASFKRYMYRPHEPLTSDIQSATPFELSVHVLESLRSRAATVMKRDMRQAVITVPAYFDDTARQATRQAAFKAGWTVLRLINEPTAAAYAYGLETESKTGLYMVYDWGGGTFDVSILEFTQGVFQVRATCGDIALGGDDVDQCIAQACGLTLNEARSAKESGSVDHILHHVQPLFDRTIALCRNALDDARLKSEQLLGIILVGGSSRLPFIQSKLHEIFGCSIRNQLDPDTLVVRGAARQAHTLTQAPEDTLLLDVNPLSLGLETMGGLTDIIIPRNTMLPITHSQDFTTAVDGQQAIMIHVVQGESALVSDCRSLARFELRNLVQEPAGTPRIRVTFEVDVDSVLSVYATDLTTGNAQAIHVQPTYGLSQEEWIKLVCCKTSHQYIQLLHDVQQTIHYIHNNLIEQNIHLRDEDAQALRCAANMLESEKESLDLADLMKRHGELLHMAAPLAQGKVTDERHTHEGALLKSNRCEGALLE